MTKIQVAMIVVCEDEALAQRVLSEYFPSMDDLRMVPGISVVTSEWATEVSPPR